MPPSEIGTCKLRVPRRSRINASRVVEYVPKYGEVVKAQVIDQAAKPRPINVVGSPVKVEDDAISLSDEESFTSDPHQDPPSPPQVQEEVKEQLNALIDDMVSSGCRLQAQRETSHAGSGGKASSQPPDPPPAPPPAEVPPAPVPAVPEHPDDERRLVEFAEGGELRDEPRLRAKATEHNRLTTPRIPSAKSATSLRTLHCVSPGNQGAYSDDLLDAPTAPFQPADSVILAKGDEHTGIGIGGVKSHHVTTNVFSGARVAHPVSKRDIPSHARNFRHLFHWPRARSTLSHKNGCSWRVAGSRRGSRDDPRNLIAESLATQLRARARCPRRKGMLQEHTPSIGFAILPAYALLSLCLSLDVLRPTFHVRSVKNAMGSAHQGKVRWCPMLFWTARLVSPKVCRKENP